MSIGLIGKKQGMTRVFTPEGDSFAVSVVSVLPNTITQIKSVESEGYSSIQVTTGEKKEKHLSKAQRWWSQATLQNNRFQEGQRRNTC